MKRSIALNAFAVVVLIVAASCASGPSDATRDRGLSPSTTTTTEPLPEGLAVVEISNGSFQPSVLNLDTTVFPMVRWENLDEVEYIIFARNEEFESPPMPPGGTWEFDFTTLPPAVYRYFTLRGAQSIPGLVDTRPAQ